MIQGHRRLPAGGNHDPFGQTQESRDALSGRNVINHGAVSFGFIHKLKREVFGNDIRDESPVGTEIHRPRKRRSPFIIGSKRIFPATGLNCAQALF